MLSEAKHRRSADCRAECVFFDAGGTLIYPDPTVGEVYARALLKRGVRADPSEVESQFSRTWTALRAQHTGSTPPYGTTDREARDWWRRVVLLTFKNFGTLEDPDGAFDELWSHFAWPAAWRLYPDALPAVKAVKRLGSATGLISNWDSRLVPILRGLGVWQIFDATAVSFRVGVEKPDPRIFQDALAQCGVPPQRALHVGDNYHEDVLGAKAVGMQALWLQHEGPRSSDSPDVRVIRTLAEVPQLLGTG